MKNKNLSPKQVRTQYSRAEHRLAARKNVVVLNVTATPFNLISQQTQIPKMNVVSWKEAPGYYGQEDYTSKDSQNAGVQTRGSLNRGDPAFRNLVEQRKQQFYSKCSSSNAEKYYRI